MKLSQTITKESLIVLLVIGIIVYLFIKKDYKPQTYKEQAIEKINLDSLKQKMYEEIKDSVLHADSVYLRSLSKMSKTELQSEFIKKFPR